MKTSWVSEWVVVKPQARLALRPMTMKGTPGLVAPASIRPPGRSIRARYQRIGAWKPRCGSEASSGAPEAERPAPTVQALLAELGRVPGSGKRGSAAARRAERGGIEPGLQSSGRPGLASSGQSSRSRSAGRMAASRARSISVRQLPDSQSPMTLAQSRLSPAARARARPAPGIPARRSGPARRSRHSPRRHRPRAGAGIGRQGGEVGRRPPSTDLRRSAHAFSRTSSLTMYHSPSVRVPTPQST